MTLYNSIGRGYNRHRRADPRIVEKFITLLNLPPGSLIADVGAGTGNYSNAISQRGYRVLAIEPSQVMQNQAVEQRNVGWLEALAEQIPVADKEVDGTIVMLALHHFWNIELALSEIGRITRENIISFAFEQHKIPEFWLSSYFPRFVDDTPTTFSIQEIAQLIGQITLKETKIAPFLLPRDLQDSFAAAGWCRPEIYLDAKIRQGISTFAKMSSNEIKSGLSKLKADLNDGSWQQKNGHLLQQKEYDAGYRLIFTK